ncbi:hypothetical protein [Microbacterium sp.]|uniref:hypothetical protein n=1 Tax=Microbacterium sp. TaxID=51671 RepID=UPI0035664094
MQSKNGRRRTAALAGVALTLALVAVPAVSASAAWDIECGGCGNYKGGGGTIIIKPRPR